MLERPGRMALKVNDAELQRLTSSDGWRLSFTEVERRSTELTQIVDEILMAQRPEPRSEDNAKDANEADVSKTEQALPDTARKRKVKVKEMGKSTKPELSWTGTKPELSWTG